MNLTNSTLRKHIEAIEESYEFFLAFAAQGIRDDTSSPTGGELRRYLQRTDSALLDIAQAFRNAADDVAGQDQFRAMIDVLEQDAHSARAAVQLVLTRPAISSQLIDNLNASIHVRALLTDLFLLDEALPRHADPRSTEQTTVS